MSYVERHTDRSVYKESNHMRHVISPITLDQAEGTAKELLTKTKSAMGMVPNLMGVYANNPAVLGAYLGFNQALTGGVLTPRQREQIALAVAESNRCSYCLSAHTLLGKGAGLNEQDVLASRQGLAIDTTTQAILTLATKLVETRGQVGPAELAEARNADLTDAQILETVAQVALNILTNYTNNLAGTEIDFPVVRPGAIQAELSAA